MSKFCIQQNALENVVCEIAAILSRPQCVDGSKGICILCNMLHKTLQFLVLVLVGTWRDDSSSCHGMITVKASRRLPGVWCLLSARIWTTIILAELVQWISEVTQRNALAHIVQIIHRYVNPHPHSPPPTPPKKKKKQDKKSNNVIIKWCYV